ncbi:MAG: BPSS1780 family membrane protein [Pseudomonadota bacterium]
MQVVDVRAGSGADWIKEAWLLFRAQPLAWISLLSVWLIVSFLMAQLPLGEYFLALAQPVFFAGFVLACRDQEMGKPVVLGYLLAGIKQIEGGASSTIALIQVGAVTLLAKTLLLMAIQAMGGLDGFEALRAIEPKDITRDMLLKTIEGSELIWAGAILATMILDGILWFTAALIAHQPMPASHAIRWSFFAFISNFVPLLVFSVLMTLWFVVATLPLMLGMLVFFPVFAIVHYTSFKGVFRADADIAEDAVVGGTERN